MFKNKKFALLVIVMLLIVPMVLVACGDDDKDKDDGGNGGDAVSLDQSFEASGISVKYPDGWVARESEGTIQLANSEDAFEQMDAAGSEGPPAGAAAILIIPTPLGDLGVSGKDAFEMMIGFMASEEEGAPGEVEEIKLGDKDAFRAAMNISAGSDGFVVGYEANDMLILIAGITAEGEMGDHEATLMAIAESVTVSE